MKSKQVVGIIVILMMVANVLLFAFRFYSSTVFWIIIILGAIVAYMLPKFGNVEVKKKNKRNN
jgi:hypothetical protein